MNDNLEEVKRNRAALSIKTGSVFINEKTLVYLLMIQHQADWQINPESN